MGIPSSSAILPWLSLVAIIWLQAISGTNTDFPAYSTQLKSKLDISQFQLNNLAVASDAGKLFGWVSGLAANHLPLPLVLLIGATLGSIGYGVQYLYLANKMASLSYLQYFLLAMLAGNSISWINTVCYIASMRKFPADNGTVVGLTTSYSGFSAKIYIAISQVIYGRNPSDKSIYLLLNCAVPSAASVIALQFLTETKPAGTESGTRTGLLVMFVIASATGAYSVVQSLVSSFGHASRRVPPMILLVMILSVIAVPLAKAGRCCLKKSCGSVRVVEEVQLSAVELGESPRGVEQGGGNREEGEREERRVVGVGREHGARELVLSVDFWLYYLVYLCGATLGMVYLNNLGQISASRGVSNTSLISISSSFGFFGKLFTAPMSAFARSKYMASRPATVLLLMAPMAGSFFLLLNPTKVCLFVSTAIIGMGSGAITSIAVSMTSELFGSKHFGVNHNILITNIPIGSFLFGYIASVIYDGTNGGHGMCIGVQCYHKTFIIWGAICSFGTILSFSLYHRTRKSQR